MRLLLILSAALILLSSCFTNKQCREKHNYFVKVDTSRPYWVKGDYCITIKSLQNKTDSSHVTFTVFSRVSKQVQNGVIYVNDLNRRIPIESGKASTILVPGRYSFGISSINGLPLTIKKLDLRPGTIVNINAYLGDSMQ